MVSGNEPADTVKTLIGYALGREVDDNVSVVVMEVPGGKKSFRAIKPASAAGGADRAVLVAAGIGAILVAIVAVILFVVIIPAISRGSDVVIPDVPTGFAYVVDMEGTVSSEIPGSSPVQIAPGDFLQTGVGSLIRVGSGHVRLALPAGSGEVYLGENTILGLDRVVDPTQGVTSTLLTLGKGRALAVASPLPGTTFTIQAPTTTRAEVTGTIIGIEYDEITQRFEVDCLEGNCRIVGLSRAAEMAACENYFLVSMGIPNGPNPTRNALWQSIAGDVVPDASICGVQEVEQGPTPTFEPTVTIEPTATQRPFVPQPTPDAYGSGAFVLPGHNDGDGGRPGRGAGYDDSAQANKGTSVLILMSVIGGVALAAAREVG